MGGSERGERISVVSVPLRSCVLARTSSSLEGAEWGAMSERARREEAVRAGVQRAKHEARALDRFETRLRWREESVSRGSAPYR